MYFISDSESAYRKTRTSVEALLTVPACSLICCLKKKKKEMHVFILFIFCSKSGAASWCLWPPQTGCSSNEGTGFSSQDNAVFDRDYTKAALQVCKNKQGWSQSKVVLHSVLLKSMHFRSYVPSLGLLNYTHPGRMLMMAEDSW